MMPEAKEAGQLKVTIDLEKGWNAKWENLVKCDWKGSQNVSKPKCP